MPLHFVVYATFLPQNEEQIKGLSLDLTYGISDLIEKSLQRNEAQDSLAVKNPSVIFAIPITVFSTVIRSVSTNCVPRFFISY